MALTTIIFPDISKAQTRNYHYYTTQNGLPSNVIYDILEDKTGFIWIATDQGVSRFDGKNFVNFSSKDGLNDNDVFKMFEDNDGRIWFFPFKTDPCYYYRGKIYNHKNDKRILKNENPKSWVLSYSYNPLTKNLMFMQGSNKSNGKMVDFINPKDYYKLNELYIPNGIFTHFKINDVVYLTYSDEDTSLYKVENHEIKKVKNVKIKIGTKCFLNDSILLIYNYKKNVIYKYLISKENFNLFDSINLKINYRKILINSGLIYGFNETNGLYLIHNNNETQIENLNIKDKVWGGIIDKNRNIWYYSNSNGLYMFPNNKFYYYNTSNSSSMPENRCLSIAKLNKKIFIGFENNGISSFNGIQFKPLNIEVDPKKKSRILKMVASNNHIVAGGDNMIYKIFSNETINKANFNKPFAIKDIEKIDQNFLFATHSCFIISDLELKEYYSSTRTRYTSIYKLKNGTFLLGSLKGVLSGIDTSNINKIKIHPILDEARISDIKQDKNGYIWICTYSNGLFITDLKKTIHINEFSNQNNQLFISSAICKDIYFYDNSAWLSTNRGINKITLLDFAQSKFNIFRFTKGTGLPFEDINSLIIEGDTVFATSSDGLVIFNYKNIKINTAPKIVLNNVYVNLKDTALPNNSFLSKNLNNISFSISGISYSGDVGVSFKYRLIGLNNQWTYTESDKIDFVGLAPGEYQFEAQAINYDYQESDNKIIYQFTIKPPFYLTWWFISITVITLATLLYFILNSRIQNAKEKEKANSMISDLKLQALRAQMNPHFIFNALTSIQYFFSKHDELSANKYMTSFASLIRQTLNSSRKNFNSLTDEIEILDKYIGLEILRLEKPTEYTILVSDNIDSDSVFIPSMLLQPLVENALIHGIRHTNNDVGKLTISITTENEELFITIQDNGQGINESKKTKQSTGLDITKQRIETINQLYQLDLTLNIKDIKEITENETGTRVNLKMKITH